MRKLGFTALALGAALTLSLGLSVPQASAAEETTPSVSILSVDGDNLVINAGDAKEVLVGTASIKSKSGTKYFNVSSWDVYEPVEKKVTTYSDEGEDLTSNTVTQKRVTVDLSKITKDTYIRIKADSESDDSALTVKVPANSIKLKGKYDKKTGKITLSNNKTALTNETVMYRTENGFYEGYTQLSAGVVDSNAVSLSKYQLSGGALYFSVKGSTYSSSSSAKLTEEDTDVTGVKATVLPTRRSKEVKVTISKLANAPKVTADYKKNTISIPKGAVYRVVRDSDEKLADMPTTTVGTKAVKVSVNRDAKQDVYAETIKADTAFSIDVQTPGVENSKLATKIGHYTFAAQGVTTVGETTVVKTDEKSNAKGGIDFKVTNKSTTDAYTVYYTPLGKSAEKSVTIKAGKDKTLTKVSTEGSISVTVQKVGDKATTTWSGTKVKFDSSSVNDNSNENDNTPVNNAKLDITNDNILAIKVNDNTYFEDFSSISVKSEDIVTVYGKTSSTSITVGRSLITDNDDDENYEEATTGKVDDSLNTDSASGSKRKYVTFTMTDETVTIS